MLSAECKIPVQNGQSEIFVRSWVPDAPRAVLLIAHGMAEHIARYDGFASHLAADGIAVYGCDHAGHGQSAKQEEYGFFYETDGWNRVVADLHDMQRHAQKQHPGLPVVLLGHSMGSALARSYMVRYGEELSGVILSGTMGPNPALPVGRALAWLEMKRLPKYAPCPLLNKLTSAGNNKAYDTVRTEFDWLSQDTAAVDQYIADPACGFLFTATGYRDLLTGVAAVTSKRWAGRVPKNLPVLIFSGDRDPVGGMGKGVRWTEQQLRQAGVEDVTCTLYPDGRHEMLNELGREEIYADVLAWLNRTLAARAGA